MRAGRGSKRELGRGQVGLGRGENDPKRCQRREQRKAQNALGRGQKGDHHLCSIKHQNLHLL
jgi:hypothetical protein